MSTDDCALFTPHFVFSEDCIDVSLRIDFYSKKNFIFRFQDVSGGDLHFLQERLLTDEERDRIDITSVAANLGNSVNEVAERKASIYEWLHDHEVGGIAQVFVSPYFIFMYCRGSRETISSLSGRLDMIAGYMPAFVGDLSLCGMRLSSRYSIFAEKDVFPYFGLNFYDLAPEISNTQEKRNTFVERGEDGEIINNIISSLEYCRHGEAGELLGQVNVSAHSYSDTMCFDKECLLGEFRRLIKVTEKYMEICAG